MSGELPPGLKHALLAACLAVGVPGHGAEPLIVHEWGTFTCMQDESGTALRGINADDEPVPGFVHRSAYMIQRAGAIPALSKGIATCHPDVTMRLETPVIYFYPPNGTKPVVSVSVKFPGGWLTEYFPDAKSDCPGLAEGARVLAMARPEQR